MRCYDIFQGAARYILLLLAVFFIDFDRELLAQSQTGAVEISWGRTMDLRLGRYVHFVVGKSDQDFYTLNSVKGERDEYMLRRSDEQLKVIEQKRFKIEVQDKSAKYVKPFDAFISGEVIWVLSSNYFGANKEIKLFVHSFEVSSLQPIIAGKEIAVVPGKTIIPGKERSAEELSFVSGALSENASQYAVFVTSKLKDEINNLMVFSIADELEILHTEQLKLAEDHRFELFQLEMTNDGEVFMLGREFHKKGFYRPGGPVNFDMSLRKFSPDKGISTAKLSPERGGFATTASFKRLGNDVYCLGLYTLGKTKETHGLFFNKLGQDFAVQEEKSHRLNSIENSPLRRASDTHLELQALHKMHLLPSGEMYVIMEMQQGVARWRSGTIGDVRTTTSQYYITGDFTVFKFSSEGEIAWTYTLEKYQRSAEDAGHLLSVKSVANENGITVLFNDRPDNYGKSRVDSKKLLLGNTLLSSTKNKVAALHIDPSGETASTKPLTSGDETSIIPDKCELVGDQLLLFGFKDRAALYGLVDF